LAASHRSRLTIGLGLIGVLAFLAIEYATRGGPWAYSDGAGYLILARNLLNGKGLGLIRASGEFQPLSSHPPLYPLALAGLGALGADLVQAARWMGAALFAALVWVVGWTVNFVTRREGFALVSAGIIVGSPWLVGLFSGVQSEPLFFVTGFGSLGLLLAYLHSRRRRWLALAGLAAGLSLLTRYTGAAFLVAGLAAVVAFGGRGRWPGLAIFGGPAIVPNLIWQAWIGRQAGADPVRIWDWNLAGLWDRAEPLRGGLVAEIWKWVPFSGSIGGLTYLGKAIVILALAVVTLIVVLGCVRSLDRSTRAGSRPLQAIGLMSGFALIYLAGLSLVFLFTVPALDAADIDERMLTPVFIAALLAFAALGAAAAEAFPGRIAVRLGPIAVILITLASYLPASRQRIRELGQANASYTGSFWQSSETLELVDQLPPGTPIISNEDTAILFHLDRPAYSIPDVARSDASPRQARFGDGNTDEDRVFRDEGAALVLFGSFYWQLHAVYGDEAEAMRVLFTEGLKPYATTADGSIYFYDPTGGEPP
jgi:hypothetical protein